MTKKLTNIRHPEEKTLHDLKYEVHNSGICTACGTCVHLCPYIYSIADRVAAVSDCRVSSGRCYFYCPRTVPTSELVGKLSGDAGYKGPLGPVMEYCIARSTLSRDKTNFQYGGVVTTLLLYALEKGMIDGAVVTLAKDTFPYPFLASCRNEILAASGSKFAVSPTNKEFNRGDGERKRLGVVALPCQATGLRKKQLLSLKEEFSNEATLIIGLFCTWALSQKGWSQLLLEYGQEVEIMGVDIPPPPAQVMRLLTSKGVREIPLEKVRKHVRAGCQVCLDMTAENADISVGMVENKRGYNTVIIRTEKGRALLQQAQIDRYLEIASLDESSWEHLKEASSQKKKRAIAVAEEKADSSLPYYEHIISLKERIW